MKKRLTALILFLVLIPVAVFCASVANAASGNAEDNVPARIINIVFDDSGSMFGQENDSWCQAKYAMEVFAAMLGPKDSMNIYVMSYYISNPQAEPRLRLSGSNSIEKIEKNIYDVHNMELKGSGTPFDSVRKAYGDLEKDKFSGEKWLVVLTDGDLQEHTDNEWVSVSKNDKDEFFGNKSPDISVIFLNMMGEDGWGITERPDKNIFYKKVDSSGQIPSTITDICQRVFNRQKITELTFDIPMSELIVFAQGKDISINGIKDGDKLIESNSTVSVRYSDTPAASKPISKVATNLSGVIATFKGDFNAGQYVLDITNFDTVEIYYTPNIDVRPYLSDTSGNEVTNMDKLEAGEYVMDFGFVKKGTNQKVPQSQLLKTVEYSASVKTNGVEHEKIYKPGDRIKIEEGLLIIDAKATYLDYNYVTTHSEHGIYKHKNISFEVQSSPEYIITKDGFENGNEPIIIKAVIEGAEFTPEQWAVMGTPDVTFDEKTKIGEFKIVKSEEPGIFNIYPSVYNNEPIEHGIGSFDINIGHEQVVDGVEKWSGETQAVNHVADGFSFLERYGKILLMIACVLLLIIIIIWIMTRKVYPNKCRVNPQGSSFTVDGNVMPVNLLGCCTFPRRGFIKKISRLFISEGPISITVNKPPGFNQQYLSCQTTISVRPVSRRITRSKMREFEIYRPIVANVNVTDVNAGGKMFARHIGNTCLVTQVNVDKELQNIQIASRTALNFVELTVGARAILRVNIIKN